MCEKRPLYFYFIFYLFTFYGVFPNFLFFPLANDEANF